MTKKEAIKLLIANYINMIIIDDGETLEERDAEIITALGKKGWLKKNYPHAYNYIFNK